MTKIDWENLGFNIMETNSYLKYVWKDGKWDSGELVRHGQNLDISLYASPFHYGQACFEGLKAFRDPQGKVRIFRPELNAKRMQKSCEAISMPFPDEKMFLDGLVRLVQDNLDFVPPYGVDGSLYIRPFVFGSSPVLGLQPSKECTFIITANPVGSYYKSGLKPCAALIKHGFDRAAPNGMGSVKVAGNYAPTMAPTSEANEKGYNLLLFLDAKTGDYVEEFATSNFAALTKPDEDGKRTYVTPLSTSILKSVTNQSLSELAANHFNWRVERRKILWSEVCNGSFDEIAACGTAVIITPINQIDKEIALVSKNDEILMKSDIKNLWDDEKVEIPTEIENHKFSSSFDGFKQLYDAYRGIQSGTAQDIYGWMYPKDGI